VRAPKITGGAVVDDPFDETLDQSAGPTLQIAIEK
jgi:hypothetical protein